MTWKCNNCNSGEVLSMVTTNKHYRLDEEMNKTEDVSDDNPLYLFICDNGCGEVTEFEIEWVE